MDNSFKEQRVSHGRQFSSDNTSVLSLFNRKRRALVSCVWFESDNQISEDLALHPQLWVMQPAPPALAQPHSTVEGLTGLAPFNSNKWPVLLTHLTDENN